jgi:hypothetical protein
MDQYYFCTNIDNATSLCISPLSDNRAAAAGMDPTQVEGYFLYERTQTGNAAEISVIAQVVSEDAAFRLSKMLNME